MELFNDDEVTEVCVSTPLTGHRVTSVKLFFDDVDKLTDMSDEQLRTFVDVLYGRFPPEER